MHNQNQNRQWLPNVIFPGKAAELYLQALGIAMVRTVRVKRNITEITIEENITLSVDAPNGNGILEKEICGEKKKKSSDPFLNSVANGGGAKKYRGVKQQQRGKWGAVIKDRCKSIWLGTFNTAEEAAIAYDREAMRLKGPNAVTNFVYAQPEPEPPVLAECHLPPESSRVVFASSGDCNSQGSQVAAYISMISPSQPALNHIFGQTTCTQEELLSQGFSGYLPPSFTALQTICSAEAEKGQKLPVPEEIDISLKSRVKRNITEITIEENITLSANAPNGNRILEKEICGEKKKKSSDPFLNSVANGGGAKKYRGVKQQQQGKWGAVIKDRCKSLWLGIFNSAEEAAIAYDREAIRIRGPNAVTNFFYAQPEPEPPVVAEFRLPQESSRAVFAISGDCNGQGSQESLADSKEIGTSSETNLQSEISIPSEFNYSNGPCYRVDEVKAPTESFMEVTFSSKSLPVASYTSELPADLACSPKMPQVAKPYQTTITDTHMLSAVAAAPKTLPFSNYSFGKITCSHENYSAKALKSFVVPCLPATLQC
ncbi:uncharacterized protein LOC113281187 isoform X2 [Papaver somniferum]|uniref:uncharacterized protein LOC113281187 isoform X2 n=1 Tax=Papaver somniferum TaxID=3469 RepID=UPI000E6FE654|nr:uncharacterized protein LOC113281187 isoform X2 [Papaver somniferum]